MTTITEIRSQFQGLSLDNVGAWPVFPRIAVWLGVVLASCVVGYAFVWQTELAQIQTLSQTEANLKAQFRVKLQQSVNLDDLRRQKEQINQYVLTLEKQLPSKAEMDALLSDINQAGIGRGLQFELFRPGTVILRDYYAELPISIRVSGRYHDLGAFASDIANLPRIVTLNNLNVQAGKDQGTLTLDATARTFRYLDEEEIAAQRSAAEAAKAGKKK